MENRLDLTIDQILEMGKKGTLEEQLDRVYQSTPLGPVDSNLINTIYGINHRQTPAALPMNKDRFGFTFFTRPRLNMSRSNLRYVRQMYPLLSQEPASIHRIIRCYLDPDSAYPPSNKPEDKVTSPYVDDLLPFIPLLSNLILSIGGWPEFVADTHTTPDGHYREAHSIIDGPIRIKGAFELSATFRNLPNNPVTLLFFYWLFYSAMVFEGEMMPYGDSVYEYEIDYNTRIWRLTMDPTNRYVTNILSTGASFPLNAPVGALGNFDSTQPYNDSQDNVTVRFQCIGMDYNEPIQIQEFNQLVQMFNPGMAPGARDQYYIQVPYEILSFFNMRGYPQINPADSELQWFIPYRMLDAYSNQLKAFTDMKGLTNFVEDLKQQRQELLNAS